MPTISEASFLGYLGGMIGGAGPALLLAFMGTQAQLTDFKGGKLYLKMEGNMSPFGVSSNTGARGAMGNVTTLYPSSASLFGNPAGLASIQGISLQSDFFLPGLGLGVSSERTKILRNNLRAPIGAVLESPENNVAEPVYPDVDLGLYQSTNLGGFAVAFGGESVTLAAGAEQPFRGKLDFALGGLRVGLGLPEDDSDPETDSIKVLLSVDAFARVHAELNDFSLGLAGSPQPWLSLGAAYHRYTADLLIESGARVDGILQRAGQESFFNADVPYHDDLNARGAGQVRGEAHGIRLGAGFRFWRRFGFDAMVSMVETMRLEGQVDAEYNTLPGLDLEGEQILSPSSLNPTKLTLTTRAKHTLRDIRINLPWEGAVSLHGAWENFKVNLDYSYYLRGLSVQYTLIDSADAYDTSTKDLHRTASGRDSVEVSEGGKRYSLGLDQQFALGFQIYQVFFQLGGILYTVKEDDFISEAAAYQPEGLPFLPTMNLGYFFPVGPRFTTTVSLVAFPVSIFKTTVEYRY